MNITAIEYELRDLIKIEDIEINTIKNRLKIIILKLKSLNKEDDLYNSISKKQHTIIKKVGLG